RDPPLPRPLPARQAHERRRRRGPGRLEQHRHPQFRPQRRGDAADLRRRRDGAAATDSGPVLRRQRPADTRGVGSAKRHREDVPEYREARRFVVMSRGEAPRWRFSAFQSPLASLRRTLATFRSTLATFRRTLATFRSTLATFRSALATFRSAL